MTPDPEAVRRALREIDAADAECGDSDDEFGILSWAYAVENALNPVLAAARAWLAAQDAKGEASE